MDRRWGIAIALLGLAGCAETQRSTDAVVAAAAAQVNPTLSTSDATFMTTAARGGIAEVQMAQLAERNGQSAAVKRFARKMLADHGQTNQAMADLARRKRLTPPESMGADQQQIYDRLATLRGRAFDRAYAEAMVTDHQQDLRAFEAEAEGGTDAEVRAMAAHHVPMLREHLRLARALPRR